MEKEDRRYQRTRQAIQDAMWQLMQEKDFGQISVGEIAKRANINRVTFYRHYEDKYAWLNSCIQELLQELFDMGITVLPLSDTQDVEQIFLNVCNHFDQNYELYSVLLQNEGINLVRKQFKKVVYATPTENIPPVEELSPEEQMKHYYVLSAVAGTMELWILNNRPIAPKTLAQKLVAIHRSLP